MTENCAAGSRTLPNDRSSAGSIGTVHPCCELKLVDVPQMGYTSQDKPFPRGELCTKGPNTFMGYYKGAFCSKEMSYAWFNELKDPKNTKEAVDEEGWLHSGDVAEFDDHNRVRIIDRIKVGLAGTALVAHIPHATLPEYYEALTRRICCAGEA